MPSCCAVNARPQRELKQVEVFYNTPQAAGSTSVDANGNLAVRPYCFSEPELLSLHSKALVVWMLEKICMPFYLQSHGSG